MASCALTSGYSIDCGRGNGGVSIAFIAELSSIASIAEASGLVTGITKVAGKRFWKFELPQEVAEGKDTGDGDPANGSIIYNHAVTFPINKRDATIRNTIITLSQSRMVIVLKEKTGRFFLYGWEDGLWLNTPAGSSGVAGKDRSGWELSFEGSQREPAYEVSPTVAALLETPGP
jgi:hypothetical protein